MDKFYQRQVKLIGKEGQEKLAHSRVLIIGAGGLGHPVASYLCGAGVGAIHIADFDFVDESNLHRQIQFKHHDIGSGKSETLARNLREQNPFIQIHSFDCAFNTQTANILLENVDLVIDATDNLTSKFLIHEECHKRKIKLLLAGISRWQGHIHYFDFQESNPCYECLYPEPLREGCVSNCADEGIVGSTAGVFGTLLAHQAISILLDTPSIQTGYSFLFDLERMETQKIKFKKNPNCSLCFSSNTRMKSEFEVSSPHEISEHVLIDLRETDSYSLNQHDKFVFVCHRGVRSLKVVQELRSQGYAQVWSLRGGCASLSSHS